MINRGSPPCQVTRPDGKSDQLGLVMLDEPTAKQSDPTVLDLQLRTLTKQPTIKPVVSPPHLLQESSLARMLAGGYSGTSLLWTPWGPSKVSCIERCPHFRDKFLLRKYIWDLAKCP